MQGKLILIVEDEKPIREMTRLVLEREQFSVAEAANAEQARAAMAEALPALILMDWMMPETSGLQLTRELKASPTFRDIPVIMLTARGEAEDAVRGLNSGCDDYLTKPYSTAELVARVRAVLRRTQPGGQQELITAGDLQIDTAAHRVLAGNGVVSLGPTEYRLLLFLASNPERVYSREQVLDRVWGRSVYVEERTVDVHVRRLRKALEPFAQAHLIQTVRGAGYRFSGQPG